MTTTRTRRARLAADPGHRRQPRVRGHAGRCSGRRQPFRPTRTPLDHSRLRHPVHRLHASVRVRTARGNLRCAALPRRYRPRWPGPVGEHADRGVRLRSAPFDQRHGDAVRRAARRLPGRGRRDPGHPHARLGEALLLRRHRAAAGGVARPRTAGIAGVAEDPCPDRRGGADRAAGRPTPRRTYRRRRPSGSRHHGASAVLAPDGAVQPGDRHQLFARYGLGTRLPRLTASDARSGLGSNPPACPPALSLGAVAGSACTVWGAIRIGPLRSAITGAGRAALGVTSNSVLFTAASAVSAVPLLVTRPASGAVVATAH